MGDECGRESRILLGENPMHVRRVAGTLRRCEVWVQGFVWTCSVAFGSVYGPA